MSASHEKQRGLSMTGAGCLALAICCTAVGVCYLASHSSARKPGEGERRGLVTPVSGSIFINDRPAAGVEVTLVLDRQTDRGAPAERDIKPFGTVDAAGNFKVSTFLTNDGAPEGHRYAIKLVMPAKVGINGTEVDLLNGAYANAQKNVRDDAEHFAVTIPETPNQSRKDPIVLPRIDLKIPGFWDAPTGVAGKPKTIANPIATETLEIKYSQHIGEMRRGHEMVPFDRDAVSAHFEQVVTNRIDGRKYVERRVPRPPIKCDSWISGRVVKVREETWRSQSIASENDVVTFSVENATGSQHAKTGSVLMQYDRNGFPNPDHTQPCFRVGQLWRLGFNNDGTFVDLERAEDE